MNLLSNSCQQTGKKSENGKNTGPPTSRAQFSLIYRSNSFGGVTYTPPPSPAAHFKETCISLQDRPAANEYTVT